MLLRNGKEYVREYYQNKYQYTDIIYPDHLLKYKTMYCCYEAKKESHIQCGGCLDEACAEHQSFYSADCSCCHRDFCPDCCAIIIESNDMKCPACIEFCREDRKCHRGCDCECSDIESDSDSE